MAIVILQIQLFPDIAASAAMVSSPNCGSPNLKCIERFGHDREEALCKEDVFISAYLRTAGARGSRPPRKGNLNRSGSDLGKQP